MRRLVPVLLFLALASCRGESDGPSVVETCTRVGERCRLGSNTIGVCNMDNRGALRCVDQH
ncbi:MAG: hypothetical protein ACQEXJ_12435 [Myxococcota bacterium]